MRGMVQAFRKATKVKLHRDYFQSSAAAAAIAAGSRGRGDGGLPVNALDLSQCRSSAAELHAEHFLHAIPTLQCAPRACLSKITAGMRQQA